MFYRKLLFGRSRILYTLILLILVVILAACGGSSDPVYETIQEAELMVGESVPAPSGDVILIVTGGIGNTNEGESLVFDMETLESLGLVRYTVSDPWLQEDIAYTGVLLSDLLAVAGIDEGSTSVNVVALDDYSAEIPISETDDWPVIIATQADGEYMDLDNSGPTRIIFPYDSYSDLSAARNMSVWNIGALEVK